MPNRDATEDDVPFARPYVVEHLPREGGETIAVEASREERKALAHANGLVAVNRLQGAFMLEREGAAGVHVGGEVEAEVVQTCVVTLDPFPATIRQDVDLHFVPEEEAERAAASLAGEEDEGMAGADALPDPIVDGAIDLGAIAAEFLVLGLDRYPRKPGAVFEPVATPEAAAPSPFAVLGSLKGGPGDA